MAKKFPSELSSRGTVKITDKLLIHNIDTGATEYITVSELLAALQIFGDVTLGDDLLLSNISAGKNLARVIFAGQTGDGGNEISGGMRFRNDNADYFSEIAGYRGGDSTKAGLKLRTANGAACSDIIIIPPEGITEYADNAAAVTAGLAVGTLYRTGDALKIVHA